MFIKKYMFPSNKHETRAILIRQTFIQLYSYMQVQVKKNSSLRLSHRKGTALKRNAYNEIYSGNS